MRELHRVVKPGGWAVLQVPISRQGTIEDPSLTDPAQREERFWQRDHVRLYGLDIEDRLSAAGFLVEIVYSRQLVDEPRRALMALPKNEPLFYCRKPGTE